MANIERKQEQALASKFKARRDALRAGAQEYGDQHSQEPILLSAEELRQQVSQGQTGAAGVAAAPAGSLGHLMLVGATVRSKDESHFHDGPRRAALPVQGVPPLVAFSVRIHCCLLECRLQAEDEGVRLRLAGSADGRNAPSRAGRQA